jgi:hypothetical protein
MSAPGSAGNSSSASRPVAGNKPATRHALPAAKPPSRKRGAKNAHAKKAAGGKFATPGQQGAPAVLKPARTPHQQQGAAQYRKLEQMKKITEKRTAIPGSPSSDSSTAGGRIAAATRQREFITPDEWEGLLNSFEDGSVPNSSVNVNSSPTGEIPVETEDLWEKLSSTRWLKSQPADDEDPANKSTIANR